MNEQVVRVVIAVAASLVASESVLAHHSFAAEFDAKQPVKLEGTLTKIEWVSPHAWLYIDVKDGTGKVANWGIELGAPNGLLRLGWTRNSVKVGDVISVEGSRARDGSTVANARSITMNGKRMFAGSSQSVAP